MSGWSLGLQRRIAAPMVLIAVFVAACAESTGADAQGGDAGPSAAMAPAGAAPDRPVVEVAAAEHRAAQRPVVESVPLASLAELDAAWEESGPGTPLGELRARHLPVWTADFDWAFPPEVCASAWELDAIAEPSPDADVLAMGDFATAAALTVMRFEHQLSRALAAPSPLAQLCVATASVDPVRSESLEVLASYLEAGARRSLPAAYPSEVVLVGVSEAAVLAVACVVPGYSDVVGADGAALQTAQAPARLQAYVMPVSRGLEDQVADTSYRVSQASHRPAEDCSDLDAWAAEWDGFVRAWIAEGQIWASDGRILTADGICDSPPPDGPDECPRDWPL